MSNIEKIRQEIERRRIHFNKEAEKYQALNNGYSQNCYGARDALCDLENFLDTLPEEEPVSKGYDEAYLNEKIAKASKTWEGVDVDKYIDEVRGREPDKGLDVTDFCKPIDPGIAKCVADHWWEMMDEGPDKSLEEAAEEYTEGYDTFAEWTEHYGAFETVNDIPLIKKAFIAGAGWAKKQTCPQILPPSPVTAKDSRTE